MLDAVQPDLFIKSGLYPTYPLQDTGSGYFFIKRDTGSPCYLQNKGNNVAPNNGWEAKSVLKLGDGTLYIVLWTHINGSDDLWFLNDQLTFFANGNLLNDSKYNDTPYAKLWSLYLSDVLYRVWYSLITPNLLQNNPDFSPSELFISNNVIQDINLIVNPFTFPCQFIDLSVASDQSDLFNDVYPSITKNYLMDALSSFSSYTENWQDEAIINGHVEIKCPFTGKLIQSNDSLLLSTSTVMYRFQAENEIFFLICHSHFNVKYAIFFPKQHVIFFRGVKQGIYINQKIIDAGLLKVLKDWHLIKPYLISEVEKTPVSFCEYSHVGHNLWNELSAIERMDTRHALDKLDKFYIFQNSEIYAPIDILFPALKGKNYKIGSNMLAHHIYKDLHLLVKPGDQYISKSLTKKIIDYSKLGYEEYSDEFGCFSKKHFSVVILFTLRFDNRSWIDQESGICKVITKLSENHNGNIALVIDGHNVNSSGSKMKSHSESLIKSSKGVDLFDTEYETAERIKEALTSNAITVFNTIGCSVRESISWCLQSDFFVAPWGAGLAKCKWVANMPGIVFSNRKMLAHTAGDLHIYDDPKYLEGATPCEYIDLTEIEDIDEVSIIHGPRANFNVSIDALYKKTSEMTERYGRVNVL
ncbi:MAG: hypothetical protein CTY16_15585 [Methylobacter sp.]|nr:MAG: hypothetical protein CTY16_15585 [Methylobacter sp.]